MFSREVLFLLILFLIVGVLYYLSMTQPGPDLELMERVNWDSKVQVFDTYEIPEWDGFSFLLGILCGVTIGGVLALIIGGSHGRNKRPTNWR